MAAHSTEVTQSATATEVNQTNNASTVDAVEKDKTEAEIATNEKEKNKKIWHEELWPAIEQGNQCVIDNLKNRGVNIEFHDASLGTVLIHGIREHNVKAVVCALENEANSNAKTTTIAIGGKYTVSPLDMVFSRVSPSRFLPPTQPESTERIRESAELRIKMGHIVDAYALFGGRRDFTFNEPSLDIRGDVDDIIQPEHDQLILNTLEEELKLLEEQLENMKNVKATELEKEEQEWRILLEKSGTSEEAIGLMLTTVKVQKSAALAEKRDQIARTKEDINKLIKNGQEKQRLVNTYIAFYLAFPGIINSVIDSVALDRTSFFAGYENALAAHASIHIKDLRSIIMDYSKYGIYEAILQYRIKQRKFCDFSAIISEIDAKTTADKPPIMLLSTAAQTATTTSTTAAFAASTASAASAENSNDTASSATATLKNAFAKK